MEKTFKDKYGSWARITGATPGFGAELADQLASKGLNVGLVARCEVELRTYAETLQTAHGVQT